MGQFDGSDVGSSNVGRGVGSNNVGIDTGDFEGNVVGEIVTTGAKLGVLLGGAYVAEAHIRSIESSHRSQSCVTIAIEISHDGGSFSSDQNAKQQQQWSTHQCSVK